MSEHEQFDEWAAGENRKQLLNGVDNPVDHFVSHPWRAWEARAAAPAPAQPNAHMQMASPIFALAVQALNGVKAWRDCEGNDGFPDEVREQIDAVLSAFELRYTTHPITGEPMGTDAQEANAWKLTAENLEREIKPLRLYENLAKEYGLEVFDGLEELQRENAALQDDALIRQLVEALEECKDSTQERIDHMVGSGLDKHKPVAFDAYVQDLLRANQALAAGRARLEGKP